MNDGLRLISRQMNGRRWPIIAGGLLGLYLIAGFFIVPRVVRGQLLKRLPALTHRRATVREVAFNPFTLALTVRGLDLTSTNGQPFAGFDEFYANFQLSSLARMAWTFREITLKGATAQISIDKTGQLNFADLVQGEAKTKTAPVAMPRLLVFDLSITNGHVSFEDASRKTPFRTDYTPINLRLTRFSTRPGEGSPYAISAASDTGRSFAWNGTLTADPLSSTGSVRITGIRLPKHSPYLEDFTRARITDGTLDLSGDYALSDGPNGLELAAARVDATLNQLQVKDPETDEVVAGIPSLTVGGGSFNLGQRTARIASLGLQSPEFRLRRQADGLLNVLSLLTERSTLVAATQPAASPGLTNRSWTLALDDFQLSGGSLRLEDAAVTPPFQALLKPMTVHVEHFTTATHSEAALHASVATDAGETVALTATLINDGPHGAANLKVNGLLLQRYQSYLAPFFKGAIAGGKADVALELQGGLADGRLEAVATNATVQVSEMDIRAGVESPIRIQSLQLDKVFGSLADRKVVAGGLHCTGATLNVERGTNGRINLLSLLPVQTNSAPSTNTAVPLEKRDWSVALNELTLSNWTVHFTDRMTRTPGKADLDQLEVAVRGLEYPSNTPAAAELSLRINGTGQLHVQGKLAPMAQAGAVELAMTNLELRAFQPWIEPFLAVSVESGTLNASGHVEIAPTEPPFSEGRFAGNVLVQNFSTIDQNLFKEFVKWDEVSATGVQASMGPNEAKIERVKVAGLKTSVIIDPERRLNLLAVLPKGTNNPIPQPVQDVFIQASKNAFEYQVGEVQVEKASVQFRDQSVQPNCAFGLMQLDGSVAGLSSRTNAMADVSLSGRFDEASPFAVSGKLGGLPPALSLDLNITNSNLQLAAFTPYMERYAGHPLNKGRVSSQLKCVLDNQQLKSESHVRIEQLLLGPRNESPDATKLPVKLAVALLKDSNGQINLDLPVAGRLDDPQFSIGPVVLKILVNLILKTAASPFKLLGALVGGGEELSFVDFEPGTARFLEHETNKLDKLIEALEKRPALSLEIEASADPAADRDALARAAVRDQVRRQRLQELSAIGQAPPSAQDFQTAPADTERLLRAIVVQAWGTNLAAAVQAAAERAAAATNAPPAARHPTHSPSLLKRFTSLFKPAQERAATREAHHAAKADALLLQSNPQLAQLSSVDMETLAALKADVPKDALSQLIQERGKAVQAYLLAPGKITDDRLFLIAPKHELETTKGEARANLGLN